RVVLDLSAVRIEANSSTRASVPLLSHCSLKQTQSEMNVNEAANGAQSEVSSGEQLAINGIHGPSMFGRTYGEWLNGVCIQVLKDMNEFGICVIDHFIGAERGELILNQVKSLYDLGVFREGQTVSRRSDGSMQQIRGDKTVWVEGTEACCDQIGFLVQTFDSIVMCCNKMQNNGQFSKYNINMRTKAMVACYPGNGTRYVKHVDNPNQDGRCITCIYYLNKNWDVQKDGGLLRLFPVGQNRVADIAPLFDRAIFFWSDRRNPHEVQPALATRFAITVWYFDSEERKKAIERYRQQRISLNSAANHFELRRLDTTTHSK
ncbi:hypothetical protein B4U79_12913, partial [Dinothrombium tinctorium]